MRSMPQLPLSAQLPVNVGLIASIPRPYTAYDESFTRLTQQGIASWTLACRWFLPPMAARPA
jgi:hypothetical protein